MLVLKLQNGKDSGEVSKRNDFKLATGSLDILGRQGGRVNSNIPKSKRESRSMRSCDQIAMAKLELSKIYASQVSSSSSAT